MDLLNGFWHYVVPFLGVLTILVFVHELGHYLVARRCGVKIEVFSFGFGPELIGRTDSHGTRWKFSLIPLGGYVKMFGDAGPASTPDESVAEMTPEERKLSFFYQPLGSRTAIVAAGPLANFLFAIVVLALLFMTYGQPFTPPDIGSVSPGSAAEAAGIKPGDVVLEIDGNHIQRFEEIQYHVRLAPEQPMKLVLGRAGQRIEIIAVPKASTLYDRFGNSHRIGLLGIGRAGMDYRRHDPVTAIMQAGRETIDMTSGTLTALWQMISGTRSTEDLGGPLRIAQMSGEVAETGLISLIWFMAILSINLGLINLFPVPLLDGGHLLFYGFEAVLGRPLDERTQEYGFRIGLALVLTLMVFATWNDLVHLRVVEFFRGLIS